MRKREDKQTTLSALGKPSLFLAVAAFMVGTGVMQAQSASPLTVAVTGGFPVQMSCQQGVAWAAPTPINVTITSTASTFFYVDLTTTYNPPAWLTLGAMSGQANSSGVTVGLSPAEYCLTMIPGVYNATIAFDVLPSGATTYLPKTVAVRLTVDASPPALSASVTSSMPCVFTANATAPTEVCSWSSGAAPVLTVSLASSGAPVSFGVTSALTTETSGGVVGTSAFYGVANPATVSPTSSIGYSWGTPLTVTFSTQAFIQAQPDDSVTETVTIAPAAGSAIALSITINVTAPVPLITSASPALVPVDANPSDTMTVVLNGSGFVPTTTANITNLEATMVYYCSSAAPATCVTNETNIVVGSPTELIVSYPVTATGYTSAAGTWYIGVCNPNTYTTCSVTAAGSVVAVTVTTAPIVTAVTSASTFLQGATSFAPYDIVSIFGQNFCLACAANTSLTFTPTAASDYRYPTTLTPDSTNYLTVEFYDNAATPNQIGSGYLLFGNNTQINVLVPSAVANSLGAGNIRVGYGPAPPAYSLYYPITYVAIDPGIFTVNSAGAGQGAILNYDWTANSATNPVNIGGKTTSQQVVHIYLTGLGVPNSSASINTAGPSTPASPGSCVAITGTNGLLAAANTVYGLNASSAWTSLDGAVINNAVLNGIKANHLPPCLTPEPTVTIGGVAATVTYAGWVTGAVAGLYQIDAQVSSKVVLASPPNALPVVVTIGTKNAISSQAGVTVEVTN